jgi:phage-related minor tail protein
LLGSFTGGAGGKGTGLLGIIGGWFPSAKGNAFSGGNVIPFARGGVVSSPTLFPMASGMGLMGEAGPEAVVPLTRLANGKLGVATNGSGGGNTNVININVAAGAGSGDAKRDEALATRINNVIKQELRKLVQGEIVEQMRSGNTLNPVYNTGGFR